MMKRTVTLTLQIGYDVAVGEVASGDQAVEALIADIRGMRETSVDDPLHLTYEVLAVEHEPYSPEALVDILAGIAALMRAHAFRSCRSPDAFQALALEDATKQLRERLKNPGAFKDSDRVVRCTPKDDAIVMLENMLTNFGDAEPDAWIAVIKSVLEALRRA